MLEPHSTGYTESTSVPLYYCVYGPRGAPRILVLHGGPGADHGYLLPQMLRLADRFELVFYDQRGGGRSRTDDHTPITAATHVGDLAAVIRELNVVPLTLIGYSWGGLLALLYLIDSQRDGGPLAPERLVLIDPAPATRAFRSQFEAEFERRQKSPEVAEMRQQLATSGLREKDPGAYQRRLFELSVVGYFANPSLSRDLTAFRVIAKVQQSVWQSLGDYDLLPDLRPGMPTLIVHGRDDPIPLESSVRIARALAARLVVLDQCGHVPYIEQPEALFPAIVRFLDETAPQQK